MSSGVSALQLQGADFGRRTVQLFEQQAREEEELRYKREGERTEQQRHISEKVQEKRLKLGGKQGSKLVGHPAKGSATDGSGSRTTSYRVGNTHGDEHVHQQRVERPPNGTGQGQLGAEPDLHEFVTLTRPSAEAHLSWGIV
eukprot:gene11725-22365_t